MRGPSDNTAQNLAPINAALDRDQTRFCDASYISEIRGERMDGQTIGATRTTSDQTAEALIARILQRYHAVHRDELATLGRLARRLEPDRKDHWAWPHGLSDFLAELQNDLEHHMQREEMVLFPTLLAGGGGCAPFALRRMRAEHDDHAAQLARLRALTNDFVCPNGADEIWKGLYAGCAKLHEDLCEHIRIENEELFPLFE